MLITCLDLHARARPGLRSGHPRIGSSPTRPEHPRMRYIPRSPAPIRAQTSPGATCVGRKRSGGSGPGIGNWSSLRVATTTSDPDDDTRQRSMTTRRAVRRRLPRGKQRQRVRREAGDERDEASDGTTQNGYCGRMSGYSRLPSLSSQQAPDVDRPTRRLHVSRVREVGSVGMTPRHMLAWRPFTPGRGTYGSTAYVPE